jgi:hypothetical protein
MWNEVDLSASLMSRINITIPLVIRDSFNLANPQLYGAGAIVDVALTKYLSISGGYLFVGLPHIGPGYNVNVPLAALTLHHRIGRFRVGDRNRWEQLRGLPGSPVRYRNKLLLDLPLDSGRWTPFVSDEMFWDDSQSAWTQNRFEVGVGRELTARLRLDSFFLERTDLEKSANNVHAIGLALEIHIGQLGKKNL